MVGLIERASDRFLEMVVPTVKAQASHCFVGGLCRSCNCFDKKYQLCCINSNGVVSCTCSYFVRCRIC